MKAKWIVGALLLVLLMGSSVPAGAQGVVSLSIDDFRLDEFPRAQALVTVRNENGVPITGLGPEKFEIVEDGRSSFPPAEAVPHTNPDAVVSVMMVIDISGSMRGKPIEEAMRAANALLDQLSAEDRVAIIAFADDVNVDPAQLAEGKELGFTTDKNAVRNVVNFLNTKVGKDTPLYDAIYKGVKMVSTEPAGKRALVVMTDGKDERDNAQGVTIKDAGSLSSPDDPINEANRFNIPIFSIGLGSNIDAKYLGRLAERTGGVYQQAPQPEELTPLFENALDQLKQQYTLTYDTTLPQDGNYHSLLVRVQLPQGQAFAETKFQFVADAPPPVAAEPTAEPASGLSPPTAPVVAQLNPSPPPAVPTPEPSAGGLSGIVDTVRDTVQERPLLAAVIAAGVLLLLILIIALVIVLLRGRGAPEEEFATAGYDEVYAPPSSGWMEGATTPGTPVMGAPVEGRTEVATSDWPGAGAPGPAPVAPPFAEVAPGSEIPPVGGTRIIERAPKHLAMLVDKSRPDRKYDLKGTTNVGRAQDNQIVLDDPTVSRQHAWIKAEGEEFLVFDIGSANGTFVNDQPVEEPRRLENGDVVRFGEVSFVYTKVF
jgi:VWFA-related protein